MGSFLSSLGVSTRALRPWLPKVLVPLVAKGLQSLDDDFCAASRNHSAGLCILCADLFGFFLPCTILGIVQPILQM